MKVYVITERGAAEPLLAKLARLGVRPEQYRWPEDAGAKAILHQLGLSIRPGRSLPLVVAWRSGVRWWASHPDDVKLVELVEFLGVKKDPMETTTEFVN